MAKTKFTVAQQAAIDSDAANILVSAAAGSGKTAVLTGRILRHISRGINIDNLLVVTFTEAASAEMRERIGRGLSDAGMLSQVARLPMANISTIHSFCRKLVQEHFQLVELDPAFRVGDDAELSLLRAQAMDELFEQEYERDNNEAFLDLADVYGGKTMDGRLDELVRKLHDFMESDPFPSEAAQRYVGHFADDNRSLDDTPWTKIVREELALGLIGAVEGLCQTIAICHVDGGPSKYMSKLAEEQEMLEALQDVVTDGSFEQMYEKFCKIDWGSLPRITEKDDVNPDLKKRVQDIRNKLKKSIDTLVKGVFFAPPSKMRQDLSALRPRITALMELTMRFSAIFAAEKRARNLLDFSDLEHFAIKILYPNGKTDSAPIETYMFHEVLIDEYQDSNAVQDLILSAVAQRRFMVGDVKQSIYRFRRANPGLFLAKYRDYKDGTAGTRIDLSDNFRSRPEVLDSVNFFFSQLMCPKVGEVEYDHAAALHPGRGREEYPPYGEKRMWVELLDQEEPDEGDSDLDADEEETPDNIIAETRMIAKCIIEVLENRRVWDNDAGEFRPCKPGDIAILSRGLSTMAGAVIEELKNHGIDAIADMDAGFLDQSEVKTALAFLRVTDNPRQDIELLTALHSPVYGLTEDELLEIRQFPLGEDVTAPLFYDHLMAYCGGLTEASLRPAQKKARKFLADLKTWRDAALYLPISRLIGLIYDTTQYPSHVVMLQGGTIRQANLRLLLERAIEFEETSLKGLFHFISYIERLYDSGVNSRGAVAEPAQAADERVRIMTIHKSKGLEFPVVICAFLGKKFNTDDMRQPVILHSDLGVGPYYVDTKLRTRANTLARFSLSRLWARESLSEEMRCLYVALTRAKELLILTARTKSLQNSIEKWANHIGGQETTLPAYYRSSVKSYLDWIMPCLLRHHSAAELTADANKNSPIWDHPAVFRIRRHRPYAAFTKEAAIQTEQADTGVVLKPYDGVSALPSKLSISEIKRLYDITPDSTIADDPAPKFELPTFLKAKSAPTQMQMGSVLHVVAEHLDYSVHTTSGTIEDLICELISKSLLTEEDAELVDRSKIIKLANSPLAERIRNSSKVYRETPFILALPAAELYPDNSQAENETVLVHGIIDCFFEEDGEIVLVDYKSDAQPARHITQMQIYKKAVANATAKNVKEILVYSFALGKAVAL